MDLNLNEFVDKLCFGLVRRFVITNHSHAIQVTELAMQIRINPVVLPGGLGLCREVYRDESHVDRMPLQPGDRKQYDYRTVFYDVFFSPDHQQLHAIGPPLLNLKKRLLPVAIFLNGKRLRCRLVNMARGKVVALSAPTRGLVREQNEVVLQFNDAFTWAAEIPRACGIAIGKLALMTVQKDNRIRWIRDWINYYRKAWNVDTVILYDNSSSYQSCLNDLLSPEIYIVPWNFPYGPVRSHANKFCQMGALNHCRMRFGNDGRCMCFDIDELLVARHPEVYRNLRHLDFSRFDSFQVPYFKTESDDYSFGDFPLREKQCRGKAHKYAYRFSAIRENLIHTAHAKRSWWSLFLPQKGRQQVRVDDAYFLHYQGITTNWKRAIYDRLAENDSRDLVKDDSVIRMFHAECCAPNETNEGGTPGANATGVVGEYPVIRAESRPSHPAPGRATRRIGET